MSNSEAQTTEAAAADTTEKPARRSPDTEMKAMAKIIETLEPLDEGARFRVLRYVEHRFEDHVARPVAPPVN